MDYQKKNTKKLNFLEKKFCVINSLKEVNCFLSNLIRALTIKKIIKK